MRSLETNQAAANRFADSFCAVRNAEFRKQCASMRLYGAFGNGKTICNLLIQTASGDQLDNVEFTKRERDLCSLSSEFCSDRSGNIMSPSSTARTQSAQTGESLLVGPLKVRHTPIE